MKNRDAIKPGRDKKPKLNRDCHESIFLQQIIPCKVGGHLKSSNIMIILNNIYIQIRSEPPPHPLNNSAKTKCNR